MPEGWKWLLKPEILWFFVGLILLFSEFFIPGVVILFFGLGAWLTALVCLVPGIPLTLQLLIFLASSLIFLFTFRQRFLKMFDRGKPNAQFFKDSLDDCIGKRVLVVQKIDLDRKGRVEFNGTFWDAVADVPIPQGAMAEIVERENITFKVMPV